MNRENTRKFTANTDPFVNAAGTGTVGDVYEVLRTAIYEKVERCYRLELVKSYQQDDQPPSFDFSVHAYRLEEGAWERWHGFPEIHRDDADAALSEAFRLLEERV